MANIGYGYGSEWHLLHEMGRRRAAFTSAVESATGLSGLSWLDHEEYRDPKTGVLKLREQQGLEFLGADAVRTEWERLWPQSGAAHTWDAVGRAGTGPGTAWVLVEAKAHVGELASACAATDSDSVKGIRLVLDTARQRLGVDGSRDWLTGYYQYANRLALLDFLVDRRIEAHLVFIYFTGDRMDLGRAGRQCPTSEDGWKRALAEQDAHIGLPRSSGVGGRVHRLFLPAHHANVAARVLKPAYRRSPNRGTTASDAQPPR